MTLRSHKKIDVGLYDYCTKYRLGNVRGVLACAYVRILG